LFFIGRDAENDEAEVAGAKSIEALQEEIKALRLIRPNCSQLYSKIHTST
jgi:hypothetical protein